jgi:hypothetical protein
MKLIQVWRIGKEISGNRYLFFLFMMDYSMCSLFVGGKKKLHKEKCALDSLREIKNLREKSRNGSTSSDMIHSLK